MKRVYLEESWPDSWKYCYLYDLEEVYGEITHRGYAYAYDKRRQSLRTAGAVVASFLVVRNLDKSHYAWYSLAFNQQSTLGSFTLLGIGTGMTSMAGQWIADRESKPRQSSFRNPNVPSKHEISVLLLDIHPVCRIRNLPRRS